MTKCTYRSEAGMIHLAIVIIIVGVIVAAVATFFTVQSRTQETKATEQSIQDEIDQKQTNLSGDPLMVNRRNTARRTDVSRFLGGAAEFQNNNMGNFPTSYENGSLMGDSESTSASITMEMYAVATIETGEQDPITSTSELRFVTSATCDEDGSTSVSSSSRNSVVQFAIEKSGGGYTSECQEA